MSKIRAFLDTDVFARVPARQVLQELLFARTDTPNAVDLTRAVPHVQVVGAGVDIYSEDAQAELRALTDQVAHTNDVSFLRALVCAMFCSPTLRFLLDAVAVRSETPEEFFDELGIAA